MNKGANSNSDKCRKEISQIHASKYFIIFKALLILSGELFRFNYPVSFFDECLGFHFATSIFMLLDAT